MSFMGLGSFKPKPGTYDNSLDLGWVPAEFECFEPDPKYGFGKEKMRNPNIDWPTVVPVTPPAYEPIPRIILRMIESTWKYTEVSSGANRGNIAIGTRGGPVPASLKTDTYHPQVRPTTPVIKTTMPNASAIASDWKVFDQIKRTNAVTFRGDSRPPQEVLHRMGGFTPPNSRTDRYYLENNIYHAFQSYLKRRYARDLSKEDFLNAVDKVATSDDAKRTLVDFMMWRKITEGESMHLGRMVENECLKGYISTSRRIDTSVTFATNYNSRPGWLYVTIVVGGFVVPPNDIQGKKQHWGTGEYEIAQWGPIPSERIVGFCRTGQFYPEGPIFLRRWFRKKEPKAFEYIYKVMSGMVPKVE